MLSGFNVHSFFKDTSQSQPLFVFLCSVLNLMTNIVHLNYIKEEIVDAVVGIQTQDHRMVGTDGSTDRLFTTLLLYNWQNYSPKIHINVIIWLVGILRATAVKTSIPISSSTTSLSETEMQGRILSSHSFEAALHYVNNQMGERDRGREVHFEGFW